MGLSKGLPLSRHFLARVVRWAEWKSDRGTAYMREPNQAVKQVQRFQEGLPAAFLNANRRCTTNWLRTSRRFRSCTSLKDEVLRL